VVKWFVLKRRKFREPQNSFRVGALLVTHRDQRAGILRDNRVHSFLNLISVKKRRNVFTWEAIVSLYNDEEVVLMCVMTLKEGKSI